MITATDPAITRFEEALGASLSLEPYQPGSIYIINGSRKDFKGRRAVALLPFCIRDPRCRCRLQPTCDFSSGGCAADTAGTVCGVLREMGFPFYFIVRSADIPAALADYLKRSDIESCITLSCPRDMVAMKEEFAGHVRKFDKPVLLFLLEHYGRCKMLGRDSRDFDGQTTLDTGAFRRALRELYGKDPLTLRGRSGQTGEAG